MAKDNKSENKEVQDEAVVTTASETPVTEAEQEISNSEITQGKAGVPPTIEDVRGNAGPKPEPKPYVTAEERGINAPNASPSTTVAAKPSSLVKVKIKSYTKCRIGPKFEEFLPGRIYQVTPNVRDILEKGDRLGVI